MLVFDLADDGFDGGAALHQFFDGERYATFLTLCIDAEPVGIGGVVTFVSGIGQYLFDLIANQFFHAGDDVLESVTVARVAGKGRGMDGELSTFRTVQCGGECDLRGELTRHVGLAFANAFDLRRMQGIDLAPFRLFVLPLFLGHHAGGEEQRAFENLLQLRLSAIYRPMSRMVRPI